MDGKRRESVGAGRSNLGQRGMAAIDRAPARGPTQRSVRLRAVCIAGGLLLLAACGRQEPAPPDSGKAAPPTKDAPAPAKRIRLTSPAFKPGKRIPKIHTGEGKNQSPPLAWSEPPEGTKELVLICDDPDAPSPKPWVHWVVYGIDPKVRSLPAGLPPKRKLAKPVRLIQGQNSWQKHIGYLGPMPPRGHGPHHYHFRIYALSTKLDLPPGATKAAVVAAMKGKILATGELIGTYER